MTRRAGKVWPARSRRTRDPMPDPYAPNSEAFATRSREFETVELDGTVRVDIGAPLHRMRDEPQPRLRKGLRAEPAPTPATPVPQPEPTVPAADTPREPEAMKPGLGRRS